jgi:hypothetical protein
VNDLILLDLWFEKSEGGIFGFERNLLNDWIGFCCFMVIRDALFFFSSYVCCAAFGC